MPQVAMNIPTQIPNTFNNIQQHSTMNKSIFKIFNNGQKWTLFNHYQQSTTRTTIITMTDNNDKTMTTITTIITMTKQ